MTEIEEYQYRIQELKKQVEVRDNIIKLRENRLFKKVILEYFCTEQAAQFVHNSVNMAISKEQREDSLALAQASGHLLSFLAVQERLGSIAEDNIRKMEKELSELMRGDE